MPLNDCASDYDLRDGDDYMDHHAHGDDDDVHDHDCDHGYMVCRHDDGGDGLLIKPNNDHPLKFVFFLAHHLHLSQ